MLVKTKLNAFELIQHRFNFDSTRQLVSSRRLKGRGEGGWGTTVSTLLFNKTERMLEKCRSRLPGQKVVLKAAILKVLKLEHLDDTTRYRSCIYSRDGKKAIISTTSHSFNTNSFRVSATE